ncbi:MAG: hypothetical protein H6757_06345 [Candidatus Omnitrophica bacterium]|nr:hypothetical protein [Candidatus Omnitrophota bacterium]
MKIFSAHHRRVFLQIVAILWMICTLPASVWAQKILPDSPRNLVLPDSLGEISERYTGDQDEGWIILIRNGSSEPGVQENIAAVIDYLNERYGLNRVMIEGESGQTSLPESWGLPNIREKNMLARFLLESRRIDGSVYASLFSHTPVFLTGAEDPAMYTRAKEALNQLTSRFDFIRSSLSAFEDQLAYKKKEQLNPDLYALDSALDIFYDNQETEDFLIKLSRTFETYQIDMDGFPQWVLAQKAYGLKNEIKKPNFQSEIKRLEKAYKKRFSSFEEIVESGELTEKRLEHYPHVWRYVQWLELKNQIQLQQLQSEINTAMQQMIQKLSRTPSEEAFSKALIDYYHVRRMLLLKAVPEDLSYWESFQQGPFSRDFNADDWTVIFTSCDDFYSAGRKRSLRFVESVLKRHSQTDSLGVLAGSFLSNQILTALRQKGISYLYITPAQVENKTQPDLLPYEKKSNVIPAEDHPVLPEPRYSVKKTDRAFIESLRILIRTRSLYAAGDHFDQTAAARSPMDP